MKKMLVGCRYLNKVIPERICHMKQMVALRLVNKPEQRTEAHNACLLCERMVKDYGEETKD